MTTSHPVPGDVDPLSMDDLVHDCREVSGVLGSFVPTIPVARRPLAPESLGAMPVEIPSRVAADLDGYGQYGS